MKIARVSATFPPYMAGTGNACHHYVLELAKLGYEVTIFPCRQVGLANPQIVQSLYHATA